MTTMRTSKWLRRVSSLRKKNEISFIGVESISGVTVSKRQFSDAGTEGTVFRASFTNIAPGKSTWEMSDDDGIVLHLASWKTVVESKSHIIEKNEQKQCPGRRQCPGVVVTMNGMTYGFPCFYQQELTASSAPMNNTRWRGYCFGCEYFAKKHQHTRVYNKKVRLRTL